MGERSGTGPGPNNGGAGGGGDIDWSAVFNGLATATAAQPAFSRPPLPQDQSTHEQQYTNPSTTSVWDHLFPPPIPPGVGRTEPISTSSTPRSVEAGPSRPKTTQSFSAPITPNPQYTNQTDFFARLSHSMYGFDDLQQHPQGPGTSTTVPPPLGGGSLAHLDLEERLRKNHGNTSNQARHEGSQNVTAQWQDSSAVASNLAFALPPPHPSFARSNPPARSQSLSSWQNFSVPGPGPSSQAASFTPPDGPSGSSESTPAAGLPPGTPLQPVADMTPGGALDTEDKRQRNTLASAKFRAKRKKHMANISQRISELEGEQTSLTRDVADLKQENKFLREMVEIKYGLEAKSSTDSKPNINSGHGVTARSPSQSPRTLPSPSAPRRPPAASHIAPSQPQHPRRPAPLDLQAQPSNHAQSSIPPPLHHHNQAHLGYTYSPLDQPPLTGGISSASTLSSLLNAQGEWETYQSQYDASLQDHVNPFQTPDNRFIEQNQVDDGGARSQGAFPLSNHTNSYPYSQSHRPP